MMSLLSNALGLVGNVAGSYMERKADEQKLKARLPKKVAAGEVNWENQWASNANNGWLDEFYGVSWLCQWSWSFLVTNGPKGSKQDLLR